jgi:putative FmdB family regulatory protein
MWHSAAHSRLAATSIRRHIHPAGPPLIYNRLVPRYEYRCRSCGDTFLLTRPMSESGASATCPHGHDDTVKLLSTVAVGGLSSRPGAAPAAGGGGGCCGGGCGCGS